jgi:GT2 family glycosyltransferase
MDLSIILVNYNSGRYIFSCLESIRSSLLDVKYEVTVVDNGSRDGSREKIREEFPDVRLLENRENVGFGRAVNQALPECGGKVILILNPDVTLLPGSVKNALRFLEENGEVGLLLPKLLNPDRSIQFSCRTFPSLAVFAFRRTPLGRIFPDHKILRRHLMADWNHEGVREVDWGLGACMLIPRAAMNGSALFDERFFLYFEDMDLCFRLKREGRKVVYYPEAVMTHHHVRQSAQGFLRREKWEHLKSLLKFYWKHRRTETFGFFPRMKRGRQ